VGGVDIITTASPAVAHTVKKYFPSIEVRASINMRIGTVKGMDYLADLFDSFHVMREYNRDLAHLHRLKAWADTHGKKLVLLANSGCFSHCSGQIFHDNLVAHEAEICEVHNIKDFTPYVCWRMLKDRKNWPMLLQNTWVRPEDIHYYEGLFDTVKLATRMHSHPGLVIDAYVRRSFFGNTLDLFEPGFGCAIAPYIINNQAFPKEWFAKTSSCDKLCDRCGYCERVLEQVLIHTEE
jgi:collagenase-like PrtC family protease